MQSDFATTDAQEAAELDDGRLDLSGSIYHDINDPPHVLLDDATDFLAKNALKPAAIENYNSCLSRKPERSAARVVQRMLNLRLHRGAILNCSRSRGGKRD
jgi:hypothetical protein